MRRLAGKAALAAVLLAGGITAQVATDANSGYKTEEGRKQVAKGLADPQRDQSIRPGQLTAEMGLKPGMTVADVGTGVGYMLPFLSKRVGDTGHVIAEDITDDFLGMARQHADSLKLTNVTFVKGNETSPNLPEGKMDQVLVLDAYHHFDYPEKMLASIHKSLKPDGRLVIVEYYKRQAAMPNGRALTHIRLDMPDVIKEVEANHFHLVEEKERIRNVQYMLILEKD
ncbi:MAG TPA: methyltransferase domain-containing protein [Candidatus Sulfopaludibacter sp.]|jgi:ubiquinone/menaquinone biosynthesis C-methylase UbiE|nr:methyltransferase domain-containing protein [Candidatus Sulfopaludibacter sp.]